MIKQPTTAEKRWIITNTSDLFGTIFSCKNMDFSNEGYATLAKRSRALYSTGLDAYFGRVSVIEYYDSTSEYFVFTNDRPYKLSFASDAVTITDENATSNMPSMDLLCRNDMVNWQGYLYATSTTSLRRYNGSWSTALTGSGFTGITDSGQLAVFRNKNQLAISQGNTVLLLDTSHNLVYTLTLQTEQKVTSMDWNNNILYIGTRNINNGDAQLVLWDGNGTSANAIYTVGTHRVSSVRAYASACVVTTSKGELLYFTGSTFQRLAKFPIADKGINWDVGGSTIQGRIISRGTAVDGDKIYIHINASVFVNSSAKNEAQLFNWFVGGVYCYDPNVGLYPIYSDSSSLRTQTSDIATSSVDIATDIITTSSVPVTGTPVLYDTGGGTAIGGLKHRKKYYVIKLSSTTLKLATTRQNAMDSVAIDLTSTGDNNQYLVYIPNRDFGSNHKVLSSSIVGGASAILLLRPQSSVIPQTSDASNLLYAGRAGANTIDGQYVLCTAVERQENRGMLVTSKLQAFGTKDKWVNVGVKFNNVKSIEDKIVVKYRVAERDSEMTYVTQDNSQTATFINNTSFTTTADLSNAKVGDEVTFQTGCGAGYTAHITEISVSGTTYTVKLDEVIQDMENSATALFTIDNFIKLGSITTDDVHTFSNAEGASNNSIGGLKEFNVGTNSKWIQIKLEVRGESVKIEEIYINNTPFSQYLTYK